MVSLVVTVKATWRRAVLTVFVSPPQETQNACARLTRSFPATPSTALESGILSSWALTSLFLVTDQNYSFCSLQIPKEGLFREQGPVFSSTSAGMSQGFPRVVIDV